MDALVVSVTSYRASIDTRDYYGRRSPWPLAERGVRMVAK